MTAGALSNDDIWVSPRLAAWLGIHISRVHYLGPSQDVHSGVEPWVANPLPAPMMPAKSRSRINMLRNTPRLDLLWRGRISLISFTSN
jgi:hypothetical protein